MDFLDPRTKPARRRRLIISYALMAILVLTSTFILLYSSLGYGINTKTGQIIQNGLVFVSSKPIAAQISLNGAPATKHTSARLVLPARSYTMSLSAPGYRTWSTSFKIAPQDVWFFDYALLLPTKLQLQNLALSKSTPALITQTPDRRFIVTATSSGSSLTFSQLDTNKPTAPAQTFSLPKNLATFGSGTWQVIGWSSDSSTLLLNHTLGSKNEYLAVNRNRPASSINISLIAKTSLSRVSFVGSGSNTFLAYRSSGSQVLLVDGPAQTVTKLFSNVSDFASFSPSRILYAVTSKSSSVMYAWDGTNSYKLSSLPSTKVFLSAAAYQGNEYYGVAYGNTLTIYRNPVADLKNSTSPKPIKHFNLPGLNRLNFSADSHVLLASASQNYVAYNLDNFRSYAYRLSPKVSADLVWLDNHHLGGLTAGGQAIISDYNGDNQQLLAPSILPSGEFLSTDYKTMFVETKTSAGVRLQSISLLIAKP